MSGRSFTCYFAFGGSGGAALGFANAEAHLFEVPGRFRVLGGFDVNPDACSDFELLTGVPEDCLDADSMTVEDLRRSAGDVAPDVVVITAPCKGASKLISNAKAAEPKYQRLNGLALRFVDLMTRAWAELPRLVLFENVPNIVVEKRAKAMVGKIKKLLRAAGYVFHSGHHDCGELGGLAQHRKRWLLVARDPRRVPPLLFRPPKKRVRGIGEVIGALPIPNDPSAGLMHVLPKLSFLNWVRLALIPPGGDWRDIPNVLGPDEERRSKFRRQHVADWKEPSSTVAGSGSNGPSGVADPRQADWFHHAFKVRGWDDAAGTVTSSPAPSSGAIAAADPRIPPQAGNESMHWGKYSVRAWEEPAGSVIGATRVGSGAQSVADPRFKGSLGVTDWDSPSGTVTGESLPSNGGTSVADPRLSDMAVDAFRGAYGVLALNEPIGTVTSRGVPSCGTFSVADPRVARAFDHGYRVLGWNEASFTIAGGSHVGQGAYAAADPRAPQTPPFRAMTLDEAVAELAGMSDRDARRAPAFTPVIVAKDGTWHRPLTTLELGLLQGLPARVAGKPLVLSGSGSTKWREAIGNMVPAPTARAIAEQALITLLGAATGAWSLSSGGDVWVDRAEAIQ